MGSRSTQSSNPARPSALRTLPGSPAVRRVDVLPDGRVEDVRILGQQADHGAHVLAGQVAELDRRLSAPVSPTRPPEVHEKAEQHASPASSCRRRFRRQWPPGAPRIRSSADPVQYTRQRGSPIERTG